SPINNHQTNTINLIFEM
ncbi:hypothetical protein ACVTWW_005106, partial [Escherichia coli]